MLTIVSKEALLPIEQFRLYAVITRFPQGLATTLTKIQAGVYETQWGNHTIRILVLSEFPETPNNVFWQLYSANSRKIYTAKLNYQHKLNKVGSIINRLFEFYKMEGVVMTYTVDDYVKDHLNVLSPEEIFQKFSTEERLMGLSVEELENYLNKVKEH